MQAGVCWKKNKINATHLPHGKVFLVCLDGEEKTQACLTAVPKFIKIGGEVIYSLIETKASVLQYQCIHQCIHVSS